MQKVPYNVFISSRFEEFSAIKADIRAAIADSALISLQAVDLDDNAPSTLSALNVSLDWARTADVMVLLVGETYGGPAPGSEYSYVELEYDEALGAETTIILPYFFSGGDTTDTRDDAELARFRRKIQDSHRVSTIDLQDVDDGIGARIVGAVQKAIFESLLEGDALDGDMSLEDEFGELKLKSSMEGLSLDRRFPLDKKERDPADEASSMTAIARSLANPARNACGEQKILAAAALQKGEVPSAVTHLRRANDILPLDPDTCYWLAKCLLKFSRRKQTDEARRLADRLRRFAKSSRNDAHEPAALMLLSRAASKENDTDAALRFAAQAVDSAGWLYDAHIEHAKRLAEAGRPAEAMKAAEKAIRLFPPAIRLVFREPVLRRFPRQLNAFRKKLDKEARQVADAALASELQVLDSLAQNGQLVDRLELTAAINGLDGVKYLGLLNESRKSANRQLRLLHRLADRVSPDEQVWQAAMPVTREIQQKFYVAGAVTGVLLLLTILLNFNLFALLATIVAAGVTAYFYREQESINLQTDSKLVTNKQLTADFVRCASAFEAAILDSPYASPTKGYSSASKGSLVRISERESERQKLYYIPDGEKSVLPPELATDSYDEQAANFRLYLVTADQGDGRLAVSRWRAYFRDWEVSEENFE